MKKTVLIGCLLLAGCAQETTESTKPSQPEAKQPTEAKKPKPEPTKEERQHAQLKQQLAAMSTSEKIDQLLYIGVAGTELSAADRQLLRTHAIGGVLLLGGNITSEEQLLTFTRAIQETNQKPYAFVGIDEEGGRVSRVPDQRLRLPTSQRMAQGANMAKMEDVGRTLGHVSRYYGFNMDFAPVLDVNSNPNNPIIGDRALSAEPKTVATFGTALMHGMQETGTIPVVKHFPGHGNTSVDSHVGLPKVTASKEELKRTELLPFQEAIQEGAEMIMVAHILYPAYDDQNPSSLSKPILTDLLRQKLGFNGVIITDDLVMGAITQQYGLAEAARQSLVNGADMAMFSEAGAYAKVHAEVMQAVKDETLTTEMLDAKVMRILKLKQTYANSQKQQRPTKSELVQQVEALN
ncbi:beta-N-acetylhexosaminidase [Exiguobacterium acetylicum]|uniref:beta-N-acetylhexosaminidase n=1 Tax=Exiguobacterium sp. BMC-KP TaxID=1684312 RepID=UPI0006AA261B|nr:beta-N-acetylhexosaminidase [Exiguobacterium sp. BMC-KP]KOP28891.1 beta-N-acetylhexosaminidase [Exiguobacterium sp. BMC-KP]